MFLLHAMLHIVAVCTDLIEKEQYRQVGLWLVIVSGELGSGLVSTLAAGWQGVKVRILL